MSFTSKYEYSKARTKEILLAHNIPFYEWTSYYKNKSLHLFTGKTIRKELSKIPFSSTFIGSEMDDIMKIGRSLFPKNIYVGTEKECGNYAKVRFSNRNDATSDPVYIGASEFYKNHLEKALGHINAANPEMSLCTFASSNMRSSNIYSINAIAVAVDYKANGFKGLKGKERVLSILREEHFGKTMPAPTYIVEEDSMVLIFAFKEPAYVYRHADGIKFFEWMAYIFAERIKYLGGRALKANEPVLLNGGAVAKGRDTSVRCEVKWLSWDADKVDASNLKAYLKPIEELKKECPWYKTKKERRTHENTTGWDPSFKENNMRVLGDLITIRDYFIKNGITWHNQRLIFMYCVYVLKIVNKRETAERMVRDFCVPLGMFIIPQKMAYMINNCMEKNYKFKNTTILQSLGITNAEELHLNINRAAAHRKEYQKCWQAKKTEEKKREKEKVKTAVKKAIIRLRDAGIKNAEILKILIKRGITMSFKTLERNITLLIKSGDIKPRIIPT